MKIGLIDSGVGAIAVAKLYEFDDYILLMDQAFFPYGKKAKYFLLCRSLYLCEYLFQFCDEILLACNTLSIIVLPFLKLKYKNKVKGILEHLLPYSGLDTVFIGSSNTVNFLNVGYYRYPCLACDDLIYAVEKKGNVSAEIKKIERVIPAKTKILLGCTHFLGIKDMFTHEVILPNHPYK